ncbi:MAG: hypothetical protein LAT56_03825, partial [Wenzhouxiangella sp.]|nr:hypothetical protein [Wenzhouxiangella sp.]
VADDTPERLDQRLIANGDMLRRVAGELRRMAPTAVRDCVSLHLDSAGGEMMLAGLPERFIEPVQDQTDKGALSAIG